MMNYSNMQSCFSTIIVTFHKLTKLQGLSGKGFLDRWCRNSHCSCCGKHSSLSRTSTDRSESPQFLGADSYSLPSSASRQPSMCFVTNKFAVFSGWRNNKGCSYMVITTTKECDKKADCQGRNYQGGLSLPVEIIEWASPLISQLFSSFF
jgi:hypothetical protein